MSRDDTIDALPPPALRQAVAALWRIQPPGPRNLFSAAEFIRLRDICADLYPNGGAKSKDALSFAVSNALDALGLPRRPPPARRDLGLPAELAAVRLHAAFERTKASRMYLCPLDKAGDLPEVKFGPNRIARLTAADLEELIDLPRLRRVNATWVFDAKRFSEFTWLVVEQTYPLDRVPAERAIPLLFERSRDWGAIEPHRQRFPAAVEDALFAILLAPWEDWTNVPKGYWRGFDMPWVYEINDDIFVRPQRPPSPDTLSWDPPILNEEGEEVFGTEWPEQWELIPGVKVSDWLNDSRWIEVMRALETPLFATPIAHFFVKAFLEDPLDEFLAHMLTIEAALGLRSDYDRRRDRRSATERVATRLSALLADQAQGERYGELFDLRCAYLHGRPMDSIPGEKRLLARRLAREVVHKLVQDAVAHPHRESREEYLNAFGQ